MWEPLSQRGKPSPPLVEGLPRRLFEPVMRWTCSAYFAPKGAPFLDRLDHLEAALGVSARNGPHYLPSALKQALYGPALKERALDVIDFTLGHYSSPEKAARLEQLLSYGRSVWAVDSEAEPFRLVSRAMGPLKATIAAIESDSERAHFHLVSAWSSLAGREANASTAYREAVRAIEAVAKPVVSPNHARATLGSMIGELSAARNQQRWRVILEHGTPANIATMASLVWRGQEDRHGTDDESVPLNVSPAEADAALYLAVALCRLFSSGAIARA